MRRWNWLWAVALLLALLATIPRSAADGLDERGWTDGHPAANAGAVLAGLQDAPDMVFPTAVDRLIRRKPTLVVYFSPTCPHCRNVQPELTALANALHGRLTVIGVAAGGATPAAIEEYRTTFEVPYTIVPDTNRDIGQAMQATGTPSALLVQRDHGTVRVVDALYPFAPGYSTFVKMRVLDDPWDAFAPGEYHGVAVCAACHTEETQSWELTHHSVAWNTLVAHDNANREECTSCHVTGAGQPGGWSGNPHGKLVAVGCEACHGPGGPHDGAADVPTDACVGCHDADHSIAFTVDKGMPHIDHFRASAMDPATFQATRTALFDGSAPRDLLAFADGAFVGAAACETCHQAEYDGWASSPHGTAMDTLRAATAENDAPAEDIACVQCHASPTASGPLPHTLDGFRMAESVGCESCHGPGERHVAAGGGTDNIEGLGASCPVCVLEALCTRCHTAKWDETWDLEPRLDAARHPGHNVVVRDEAPEEGAEVP